MAAGALVVEMICLLIALLVMIEGKLASNSYAKVRLKPKRKLSQTTKYPLHIRHAPDGADDAGEMFPVAYLHLKFQR